MGQDIRWKQRFQNFDKAFLQLTKAIQRFSQESDDELLRAGMIQVYEFTFELAWKTLKDLLEYEGYDSPTPRQTIKQGFQIGYLQNGQLWLKALEARNKTSHLYHEAVAQQVARKIMTDYHQIIQELHQFLQQKTEEND